MKRIAAVIFLLSTTAAPAAILCQDAPGRGQGVHWSWRDIDGRRCWFKRDGPIPPKAEFKWEKEKVREKVVNAQAVSAPVGQQRGSIRILKTRVLWEDISEVDANWIDGDAPVDLMRGEPISGPAGVGGNWVVPSPQSAGETTSFAARFAPVIESRKARTNLAIRSSVNDGGGTD
jgi:hypothetical protein